MSRTFLDITDSQIALIAGSSIIQSPGAALADGASGGASLAFGQAVFETLKRRPLETRTDFWAQLSTAPLNAEFAGARHSADLVYEHLKFLFAEAERQAGPIDDLVIIAPSNLNQTQLELLLGILNAVGKPPSSILDRALVHQHVIGKAGVHLDLQWRQMVATEISLEDDQLIVGKSSTLPVMAISICWSNVSSIVQICASSKPGLIPAAVQTPNSYSLMRSQMHLRR